MLYKGHSLREHGILTGEAFKKIWPSLKVAEPGWLIPDCKWHNGARLKPAKLRVAGVLDKNFLPGGRIPLRLYGRNIHVNV